MRIRKRRAEGIPNGPPRPSIDRIVEAVEQLPPRQRWLLRLRLRAFFVQEPRPAKPKPPRTREEDEMAVKLLAITNNGDPAIVMAPPPLPPFEIDEEKLKAAADAWARRKLGLDRPKRSKAKKTPMKRKAARR